MKRILSNNYSEFLEYCEANSLQKDTVVYVYKPEQLWGLKKKDVVLYGLYWKNPAYSYYLTMK